MELKALRNSIRLGCTTVIEVFNGVAPYTIEILTGGVGGEITIKDIGSYFYTAPFLVDDDKRVQSDTIRVTDANSDVAEITIKAFSLEQVISNIIEKSLNIESNQIVVGNQDFIPPSDGKTYFSVIIGDGKPFGNSKDVFSDGDDLKEIIRLNMRELLTINMVSASKSVLADRYRVLMALTGDYATKAQESFSFKLSKIPINFTNVSKIVGSKIPYAFNITIPIIYGIEEVANISYFNNFEDNDIISN